MEALASQPGRLNALQVSLLRLFDRGMTDEQVLELKRVLVRHYGAQLREEVERITDERGYTQADFDRMLSEPS
jgi:hypothetical protein